MNKTYFAFALATAPLFYVEALVFLQTEPELWFVSSAILIGTAMVLACIVAVCLSLVRQLIVFRSRHRQTINT